MFKPLLERISNEGEVSLKIEICLYDNNSKCFMNKREKEYLNFSSQDTIALYKQEAMSLKVLRKNMSASDSEEELDSSDVYTLDQKTEELDAIAKSLQVLEDPKMRFTWHTSCSLNCIHVVSFTTES